MPIIFGWGRQKVKDFGPIHRHDCSNCGNTAFWNLYVVTTYFSLFFIPVIPYSVKRYLNCPICGNHIEIAKEQFEYYKNLALINAAYNESRITKEEYKQLISEINQIGHGLIN